MGKKAIISKIKYIILKITEGVASLLYILWVFIILLLHKIMPFFPVLFLFDFCFVVGYPLFLRFVLKKKWFECTKNSYLKIKYLLLPYLIMELIVLLYYHKATFFIIKTIMESEG